MSIIYYDDLIQMSEVSLPNLPPIGFEMGTLSHFLNFVFRMHL